jgi:hypothetical protein
MVKEHMLQELVMHDLMEEAELDAQIAASGIIQRPFCGPLLPEETRATTQWLGPKKRARADQSNEPSGFSIDEVIAMGRPPVSPNDHPIVVAALNSTVMSKKRVLEWMRNLSLADAEAMQKLIQETSRTGKLKTLANLILPFTQEQCDLNALEGRVKLASSWLATCMMKTIQDGEMSHAVLLKMISKVVRSKLVNAGAAADEDDDEEEDEGM